MRKLFSFVMTSLDGYHETPDRSIAWGNMGDDFDDLSVSQLNDIGVLVFGRATYEGMRAYWPSAEAAAAQPEVARQMRALPKVVCSTTLKDPGWENVTVARDGVAAVRTLKQEGGKDVAIFGSSTLTGGLLAAGLVDELRLIVSPVLLGAGRTLLDGLTDPAHPVAMTLLRTTTFASGNVLACYRPATVPAG